MDRGRSNGRGRAMLLSLLVAAQAAVVLVGPATSAGAQTGLGCKANELVPTLHSSAAIQGLPYSTLVRGKNTVVRFYLTLPLCASADQWIKVSAASLVVSQDGGATLGTVANKNSLATPTPVAPFGAPAVDSQADPFFVVPGSTLAPSSVTGAYTVRFAANVGYVTSSSTKESSQAFSFTSPVAAPTNSLNVLALPMGDATGTRNSRVPQFSTGDSSAASAAISGFGTLSRIFPVEQGTGDLAEGTSGGVRYTLNTASLVDVSEFMDLGSPPDAKFCGDDTNGSYVQAKLAAYLQQYNEANGSDVEKVADRVLGLIDGGIAGCFQGYAGIQAREAWARMTPGSTRPGSLMAMEEGHNSGAVTYVRSNIYDPYHGQLLPADTEQPNRGYDINAEVYLADDRNVMRLTNQKPGWGDDRTLLEPGDWEHIFCGLGGPITVDCHLPPPGYVGAGASTERFHVVGVTDGTSAGTEIVDSYLGAGPGTVPEASEYLFVQRKGVNGEILRSDGVKVHDSHSGHEDEGPGLHSHASHDFFSFSYDEVPDATRWEFWKGAPGTSSAVLLAARDKTESPTIESFEVSQEAADDHRVNFEDATVLDDPETFYADKGLLIGPSEDDGSSPAFFVDPTSSDGFTTLINDAEIAGDVAVPMAGGPAPLTLRFEHLVESVSMKVGNGVLGTIATLIAFDSSDAIVDEVQIRGITKAVTTPIAVSSSTRDIARVELTFSDASGATAAQSEQIDDLTFSSSAAGDAVAVASVTAPRLEDLRGAFFARCAGSDQPLAVALKPATTSEGIAVFEFRLNNPDLCEEGNVGRLIFRVNDGFQMTPFTDPLNVEAVNNEPIVVIESPTIDAEVIEHRSLALTGQAYDTSDGVLPDERLEWFLSGPDYPEKSVGTGAKLTVAAPGSGRWTPGEYLIRLKATDLTGLESEATATVQILKDEDNDGMPADDEGCTATPGSADPDTDPFNAYRDFDGDGVRNVDDATICEPDSSFTLSGNFDPNTLYVPSSGNDLTFYVSGNLNAVDINGGSVRMESIDGIPVSPTDPLFNGIPTAWKVEADGTAFAKFDRQAITQWLQREGLVGKFVIWSMSGQGLTSGRTWEFEAHDTSLISPSS